MKFAFTPPERRLLGHHLDPGMKSINGLLSGGLCDSICQSASDVPPYQEWRF